MDPKGKKGSYLLKLDGICSSENPNRCLEGAQSSLSTRSTR
jgi:hypothetical protein